MSIITLPTTEDQDNETPSVFIAEFKCNPTGAVNGVIQCQITNYDTLFKINEYLTAGDDFMELVYRSMPTVKDSYPSIDKLWKVKNVYLSNIAFNGDFCIRAPVYLHHYNFEFGIKTFDTSSIKKWWPRSPTQTVQIPSFLSENNYSIGDIINFRNPLNCRVSEGKIVAKLHDENYKIRYQRYDEKNNPTFSHELTVHISKICRKDVGDQPPVQICDDAAMYKNLLIQRNDEQSMNIFEAIKSYFEMSTIDYCTELYGNDEFMFHWESMADFVSKNIFDCLFAAQFCYKLECLVDGSHHMLELSNLRVKDIKNDYEMVKHGVDNAEININSFDYIQYHCDCCRTLLMEWDYVYSCFAAEWDDKHDFCLLCVDTVIQLNRQLADLLVNILNGVLNVDCVQEIVNCVTGKVIYMELEINDNRKLKRKLDDEDAPNAKKRRLE